MVISVLSLVLLFPFKNYPEEFSFAEQFHTVLIQNQFAINCHLIELLLINKWLFQISEPRWQIVEISSD